MSRARVAPFVEAVELGRREERERLGAGDRQVKVLVRVCFASRRLDDEGFEGEKDLCGER